VLNKIIKKSYIALNILSIISLNNINNNIMSMERHDQDDKDDHDNQDLTNIVNVLPSEILLMIIEKNIIGHIDNLDDIFKFNNVTKAITEEIANTALICKAFNDIKLSISRIAYNLINKKFKILEDKARDEYVALSKDEIRDKLIKLSRDLDDNHMYDNIGGFDASVIYDIAKVLMFSSYCDIEDYLIIDAANVVFIWAVLHGNKSIIDLLLKSKVDLINYNTLTYNELPRESVLLIAMENWDEEGTLPADYCALTMAACQEDKSMADFLMSKNFDIGMSFRLAAEAGYINAMKYFISKQPNQISKEDIEYSLRDAVNYDRLEVVKFILSLGVNVNFDDGKIFLKLAKQWNFCSADILELFLDNKMYINAKKHKNLRNALHIAIGYNNYKHAEILINRGIDINAKDINGDSPLIVLIKSEIDRIAHKLWSSNSGLIKIFQLLIDHNVDVNAKDNNGKSVLMWAIESGNIDIISKLIISGVNINAQDKNGWTALMYALKSPQKDIARLLLENGAYDVDSLFYVVNNGYTDIAHMIINLGINVNLYNIFGETALICAVKKNNIDIVYLLINAGANVNAQDKDGCTALIHALRSRQIDIAKLLIANRALTVDDLFVAARNGYYDIVNTIINWRYFNIDTHNSFGETALLIAVKNNHIDIAKLLLKKNSNINVKNVNGRNALMFAVESQNIDMVKLLIRNGSDINHKDNIGNSALSLAEQSGNQCIIDLLKGLKY